MNKYRDKSDFEINKAVAEVIFNDSEYDVIEQVMTVVQFKKSGKGFCHIFDPCNSWIDAEPIISGCKISMTISYDTDFFLADMPCGNYLAQHDNPLRAAMEVFLMMKDAENEKI